MSGRPQLLEAAAQLGLPTGEADAWLGSREAQQAVAEEDQNAKGRREQKRVHANQQAQIVICCEEHAAACIFYT